MRKKQIEINGETFETSMSSVEIMLTTEVIELTEEYNNLLDSINKAKEIYLNGIEGS